jgi:hypothetical protein
MATRSLIGKLNSDKTTVDYIYCHWNGHIDNNGRILHEHYNTLEKVDALLALGDLSSLGNEIGEKHDFDFHLSKPGEDWCTAYGRDRGETGVSVKTTTNNLFPKNTNPYVKFVYLYTEDGVWEVNSGDGWQLVEGLL